MAKLMIKTDQKNIANVYSGEKKSKEDDSKV